MIGLGIESTCDETSIALVEDGKRLLDCKTYSQIEKHSEFRGVVPELASRTHLEKINSILDGVLSDTGVGWKDIGYIAIANRPGLMGSIMMGAQMARCIGLVHSIPIVPVHHLEAHLAAVRMDNRQDSPGGEVGEGVSELEFPILGLLLSGGNSSIFLQSDWGVISKLADTLDDALGEAFDKAAAILGLPYPGGPHIEKKAEEYAKAKMPQTGRGSSFQGFVLPRLLKSDPREKIQFSFSGLKTALLYAKKSDPDLDVSRLCYEFQEVSFDLVVRNIKKAVEKTGITTLVAGGGVLANETLRKKLDRFAIRENIRIIYPKSKLLCTDNGAMIACLGYYHYMQGNVEGLDFSISPRSWF